MNEEYIKYFDGWNTRKKELNEVLFESFFHEREVWWCALGVNVGSEQDGKNEFFERPVLIIKKISVDLVLVIPLTTKIDLKRKDRVSIRVAGQDSQTLPEHIRSVSTKRLLRRISSVKIVTFQKIILKLLQFIILLG